MHQVTSREAALLTTETHTNLGHTSLYVELDTSDLADGLTIDRIRDELSARLHHVPGFRRRLYRTPLKLDRPWWIEDPNFDLDYHLRHIAVPSPGDRVSLDSLIARLHERPLDRRRPLWELYLIDLPAGGSVGLFIKIHHALIDGVTGLDVLAPLTGTGPDTPHPTSAPEWRSDRLPDDTDLLIKAGWSLARSPLRLTVLALEGVARLPVLGRLNLLGWLAPWTSPKGAVQLDSIDLVAPRTTFNRAIGSHRRVTFASVPVAAIRDIRHAHDARFNDVLLALVAGSLRHWLVLHDELPTEPLIALSPILVDSVDEPLATALVPLATQRHDPAERLAEISQTMAALTSDLDAHPVEAIRSLYEAAPAVASLASRLMASTGALTRFHPPFNVYIVNAPGGDQQRYVAGAPIVHQYPLSTIVDGTGLSVSIMSHGNVVDFGFVADRDLVPDLTVLADRIHEEAAILGDYSPVPH